jgi:ComF family protein
MAKQAHPLLQGADLVVPVPLHRSRERERGFNQSDTLAGSLALPARRVLRRIRSTRPQVDLTAQERRQNVADAFVVTSRGMEPNGKVLVLVDDVTTTGATLEACARVLLAAGAREVRAITAARVATAPR